VHVQAGHDEPVCEADDRRGPQRQQHAGQDVARVVGHHAGRDEAGQAGHVGNRQVQAACKDDERLADGDETQDAGSGQDAGDVALAEEIPPDRADEYRTGDQRQ
jgi:hypothetical protein